jgi:hypothetical protein
MRHAMLFGLLLVLAFGTGSAVQATPTSTSFASNGDTAVFGCSFRVSGSCNWDGFTGYDGSHVYSPTGFSSQAVKPGGIAQAWSEIDPGSYLPSLHAYASSLQDIAATPEKPLGGSTQADANIWGVQGYTYAGDAPFLLTVSATLDSIFTNPGPAVQGKHSYFRISIFDVNGYAFAYSGVDTCPLLLAAPDRYDCKVMPTVHAWNTGSLQDSGSVTVTVSHWVNPGENFFVGAFLDASACCLGTVDSSHTLHMAFNDASQLDSFAVPGVIPEPDGLLLTGLALLALVRMRKSHNSS